MDKFTSEGLRKTWIKFYEERGHVNCGAVSLVSDGSTGVLFNVAGMQPLMPYLLGEKHPKGTRLCNVQGCVRTNDIDSVGDASHVTFFEMMGSWSLGDYFKKERCQWSFELLTQVFGFDRDHLAATVFAGDENAPRDDEGAKYREESGFKKENIYYLPAEDNWWGLEYGPCGPDSEMFYVKDMPDCGPDCKPGCHCGKYTEVGNDVFMQYEKHHDGHLTPLAQKNVDTGWGLERILAFLNGYSDVYKVDLFAAAIAHIEKASGKKYGEDDKTTKSMRILADHIRTSVMLIGDEARLVPSNTGAGYVLRRLIRRAVRHARALGIKSEDMIRLADIYIYEVYKESYPLLVKNHEFIIRELNKEIERFETTIDNGMTELRKIFEAKKNTGDSKIVDGKNAFYLYDTFGFPYELTEELAQEYGYSVDEAGFKAAMEEAKNKSRENQKFSAALGSGELSVFDELDKDIKTEFVGYDRLSSKENILAISDGSALVASLNAGQTGTIVTASTPFYATMGGQVGDTGLITTAAGQFKVTETIKLPNGRVGHVGEVVSGTIKAEDAAELKVDADRRASTCRNHSVTHLLQAALQKVLGDDVHQKGSYQDVNRTRFDFSYGQAMTAEQVEEVQKLVNSYIEADFPVSTQVMSVDEAKASGAMALFGEKYGESVRVVSMGDVSKELCGGTHVNSTGEIYAIKILSETGVAAGVRRIEAITGQNVISYYFSLEKEINAVAATAKCTVPNLNAKVSSLLKEIKDLKAEIDAIKLQSAKDIMSAEDIAKDIIKIKDVALLATAIPGQDMNSLRNLSDSIKNHIGEYGVAVLISEEKGKVNMVVMATDGAQKKGAHAGNLIKAIAGLVGGGGGGRPNLAQAGGKNPAGIKDAIAAAAGELEKQLS